MTDPKGFMKYKRQPSKPRPVAERVNDYREVYLPFPEEDAQVQAQRCMDCGVPFCHNGCPLGNHIPDFNAAVNDGNWLKAYQLLSLTNPFPEFTGRICPAPCEASCVLNIHQSPVTIEHIEWKIAEMAFEKGYVKAAAPPPRTGKKVAVIGSGPAGLAAAFYLNRNGHSVTVLERDDRLGGLLRYGIPDFKLEKWVVDRRLELMEAEGINFKSGIYAGITITGEALLSQFDAILVGTGATVPREVNIPGHNLQGIHFAMEYLTESNRWVAGDPSPDQPLDARGKHVIVIGGGDTGADCVGVANRQGALSITQLNIHEAPPGQADPWEWPNWPLILRDSSSHEEGCQREWAVWNKGFVEDGNGRIKGLQIVEVEWSKDPATGKNAFIEKSETLRELPCDMAMIAIGFMHPEQTGLLPQLGVALDERGRIATEDFQSSIPKVFAAGDARRGQSLVVWAIAEGRDAALKMDAFLQES